jgi:hypothetical protein
MNSFRQFSEHYAMLSFILALGLIALIYFRSSPEYQQIALWATIAGYVLWGVGHHILRKDLTGPVMLEYFLIALIGGLVIQTTLLQR